MHDRLLSDTLSETLAVFRSHPLGTPLTTSEISESITVGRRGTYDRLERLAERGLIETKRVGARGRVWWQPHLDGDSSETGPESSASFRSLVAAVEEYAIFLLDSHGRISTWNTGAERIKGYERQEIVGEPLDTFYTDEDVADGVPQRNLDKAAEEGSIEDEGWRVRRDGSRFWASVTITALHDDDCELTGYAKVTRDMTERRGFEQRLRRQRDALEAEINEVFERIDDAFVAVDEDWRLTYVSDRAAELVRLSIHEMLETNVWQTLPDIAHGRPRRLLEEAMDCQQSVEFEFYSELLDTWMEVRAFPSESGLSAYFRDITERMERERELEQYRMIVETVDDAIYVTDADYRFQVVNSAYEEFIGQSRDDLVGTHVSDVVDDEIADIGARLRAELADASSDTGTVELDMTAAGGEVRTVEVNYAALRIDGELKGTTGVMRDVTDRKKRERVLERQRERLTALMSLNAVVHEITDEIIDQHTREEIERTTCELLTSTDSYEFAWIGELDLSRQSVRSRVSAGPTNFFEDVTIPLAPDSPHRGRAIYQAVQTKEMEVRTDVAGISELHGWVETIDTYGIRSAAAIPIQYDGTLYGILAVYATREGAFTDEEQEMISGIGEVVGHTIASVEQKRALMSDVIVKVTFRLSGFDELIGIEAPHGGHVRIDHALPIGGDEFVVYGSANAAGIEILDAGVAALPNWREVELFETPGEGNRFQARLSEQPIFATVTSLGGRVEKIVVKEGEIDLVFHVPPGTDIRQLTDVIEASYPTAELQSQQQLNRSDEMSGWLREAREDLTDRQWTVLVAAFNSGFFEEPRLRSGEDIAEGLGISPATFHQHLRAAQRKITGSMLDTTA